MCDCHHKRLIAQAQVHLQLEDWEIEPITAHDLDCNYRTTATENV